MSVYKEAMFIVRNLKKKQVQIYEDAADYGIPITDKHQAEMMLVGQLKQMYFNDLMGDTEEVERFGNNAVKTLKMHVHDEFGDGKLFVLTIQYVTVNRKIAKTRWGNIIGILTIDDQNKW